MGLASSPPLHCWGDDSLASINNTLGKYVDIFEPKGGIFFSCVRICMEVDSVKGVPNAISITLESWNTPRSLITNNCLLNAKFFMSMDILLRTVSKPNNQAHRILKKKNGKQLRNPLARLNSNRILETRKVNQVSPLKITMNSLF